jgi:hypothetical protein
VEKDALASVKRNEQIASVVRAVLDADRLIARDGGSLTVSLAVLSWLLK